MISSDEGNLVFNLFNKYRIFYKQPSDLNLASAYINERLINKESIIFVAVSQDGKNDIPVGFTQLYPKYSSVKAVKNWILNDLYVDELYRKRGIGEKLITAVMNFAKENKAKFVQLETAKDNYTAQGLYEALGFKKQNLSDDFLVYKKEIN